MDKENYFFDIQDSSENDKVFVQVIYDIAENRKRVKLAKLLEGYGFRIQKSAFEAVITRKKYRKLLAELTLFGNAEDSIRIYKIIGKGQVTNIGAEKGNEQEDVILI